MLKKNNTFSFFFPLIKFSFLFFIVQAVLFYQSSPEVLHIYHIIPNLVLISLFWGFLNFNRWTSYLVIIITGITLDFISTAPSYFYTIIYTISLIPVFFIYHKFFNKINLLNFLILIIISSIIKLIIEIFFFSIIMDYLSLLNYITEIAFLEICLNVLMGVACYMFYFITQTLINFTPLGSKTNKLSY